ncbi:hypothetical protein FOL46_007194 [Perkinsus olseni]|uniref:Uncharacterized protein n=1 Tax=Perkinsus olseni TaxID=32597 RepID=A0A7J6MZ52_PEROL|nr:hypothetical protein FOL46_007194 [Perkinsus olseni]
MVRRSSTVSDAPTRLDEYLSSQEGVKMPTRPLPDVNQGSVPQQGTYPVKTILYSQGLPVARRCSVSHARAFQGNTILEFETESPSNV